MTINQELYFLGCKTGVKKDGKNWYLLSLEDLDGVHWNFFITKENYDLYKDLNSGNCIECNLKLLRNYKTNENIVRFIEGVIS